MRLVSSAGRMLLLAAGAALLAWPAAAKPAPVKIVTKPCTKDPRTGGYNYDSSSFSEDYIITVTNFRETSRDGAGVHGVCTIKLKYQPAD